MTDTKERILNTAEKLFAEQGYSGTSLRSVIAEAGVNLAAVHYHFRSKEALLEAVFLRRAEPANLERIAMLDALERETGNRPPEVERVIEAFVLPAFRAAHDPERGGPVFRRMMGRLYAEGDLLPKIVAAHFTPLLRRFGAAMARALPDLPPDELFWRIHFSVGAVAQALRGPKDWGVSLDSGDDPARAELALRRLIHFLGAAFRAPVLTTQTGEMHAANDIAELPQPGLVPVGRG